MRNFVLWAGLAMLVPLAVTAGGSPESVVDSFHEALENGKKEHVLELLDPNVLIFESGGAELSREEYASHHLDGDMKFVSATENERIDRSSGRDGQTAWVLTRSSTRGTYHDKEIDALVVETMLLRESNGAWTILHVHWSSRSRNSSH